MSELKALGGRGEERERGKREREGRDYERASELPNT